jgi:hypothetical protein
MNRSDQEIRLLLRVHSEFDELGIIEVLEKESGKGRKQQRKN